jgi:predicted RNA-binding protein YlqC (UPF0109 family)
MTDPEHEARTWKSTELGDEFDGDDDLSSEEVGAAHLTEHNGVDGDSPAERRLRDLVTYIATSLVDHPEEVEVVSRRRGHTVHLTLTVPEEELGKVIGRQGRIARAIRTAVLVAGSRQDVRATLDIEREA